MNTIRPIIVGLTTLCLLLLWSAIPVLAQDKHSLAAGQKALQFQIDDFLKLSSFRTVTLAIAWWD